jgi:hypothetical protein
MQEFAAFVSPLVPVRRAPVLRTQQLAGIRSSQPAAPATTPALALERWRVQWVRVSKDPDPRRRQSHEPDEVCG